ncbi:assimilatory sulfite reductase (NADPH) flavoprotein subunit [Aliikangiella sp. IMCC44359]|uniref:assimilatory sulfite reductase (NADPH) flavoprotein subunit n=1 Tax=Aliikangiella sp. IMCC44359 TaxID=3459125 RepID=UPI00403A8FB5
MNKKVDFSPNAQPLSPELLETVKGYDSKELYWLSGYCSGLADARQGGQFTSITIPNEVESTAVALKTVVLYASQTGNAQSIAEQLHQNLVQKGLSANLSSLADFKNNKLKEQQIIVMVASTHGEGEPPDDAIDFHEFIRGKRAPKLEGVRHAVLSLGDSSYEFFCQTGKDFDEAFAKLGSTVLVDRVDCDLDYEEPSANWITQVVEQIEGLSAVSQSATNEVTSSPVSSSQQFTKENPFAATILDNQKITGKGSVKHINHIEISLEGSGIYYLPGDSLGVWAKNNQSVVAEILQLTELSGDETVSFKQSEKTLLQVLSENLEISLINKNFILEYAELSGAEALKDIAASEYAKYIANHQIVDVIKYSPMKLEAQQLVDLLKPIKPRLYSIASSLEANPEEVHLTVGLEASENSNGVRYGTASNFLINELQADDEVLVYVEANKHFKLPENDKPVIMIGPGTGVAPFRAFLQQRQEESATGENWLYFGNPNFNTDFLYQIELQSLLKDKVLTDLSVAFSRDQEEKVYVQDRLLENAESVWQWINDKQASIYVCGDMNRMAKDVHAALVKIISEQSGRTQEDAEAFLSQLRKDKRYQRDVY